VETINLSERKNKINWDYDADVLYISFTKPLAIEGVDLGDGTIVKIEPDIHEITRITILNPLHRTFKSLKDKPTYIPGKKSFVIERH